jgi:zinc protease
MDYVRLLHNMIKNDRFNGLTRQRKHFFTVISSLLILLLLSICTYSSTAAQQSDSAVLRDTLQNGLRVVIVKNTLAPVVTTVTNYLVGSNEAPQGFPGMAHAQEHMMFRGSPGLSADQLADITAAMGGSFDAETQQMVTQYFFTVPSQDLDVALHIESIRMSGVLDSQKLWEQERGAIEQEVAQDLSNPEYIFYTQLLGSMFKGTVYAHDALGTRKSFNETTGAMLHKFYRNWYAPNNAILVIAGDVEPQQTLKEVKSLFGKIPSKKLPARPLLNFEPVQPETLHLKTDLPYGISVIAFRLPGIESTDYAASQIMADVLNSQRGTLYNLVPQGKALFVGFEMNSLPAAGLGYTIAAFPRGGNGEALLTEMKQILQSDLKNGFPADLVEAAKRREIADGEFQKNSIFGLAMSWSDALAIEGRQSPETDIKLMEAVTRDDLDRVARKYLDPEHAILAILTPQSSGKPVSSKGFSGTESFAPQHTQHVKLPDWADKALQNVTVPPSTLNPMDTTLTNGIRLIVQPETISNTVSVYGHIKNRPDLQIPEGQEGVDQILDQLFGYGTISLDRLAFQKALDDIAANESAGTDFSLEVLTDHFEQGVKLLADNQLHPALPENAFTIIRQQLASTIAGQLESPDYLAGIALDSALVPPHDPTLRQPTPAGISSLDLQDVKNYYQKIFRPDLTTIVVIGNIKPDHAIAVFQKQFKDWKAEGATPDLELPAIPANKPSTVDVPNQSRVQDQVTLAETVGLKRSDPDYYALQLGNHVLGGAFYATRLYRDLREKNGLVYYVSSSFNIGKTRGFYVVDYGCNPSNVAKARSIVVQNLKEMQTTLISAEELQQAKTMLIRDIPLSGSSVGQIARGWLSLSNHDLPLNESEIAARHYLRLTAEQVKAAFARWLRPDDLVQVTEGPKPE